MFDGHASLSNLPGLVQSAKSIRRRNMSEVFNWLKNLPGGLRLEKCSKEFESRGFQSLSSLKYLHPGDIDAFFPSPDKLLLAEKRILETKIKVVVDSENGRLPLKPVELLQRFESSSGTKANFYPSSLSHLPMLSNQFPRPRPYVTQMGTVIEPQVFFFLFHQWIFLL